MHSVNRADRGLEPRVVISALPVAAAAAVRGLRRLGSRTMKTVSTSLSRTKDERPFHVPGHGHKIQFAAHLIDPTRHELPEAHH
jgi:hypothetical protein